MSQVALVPVKVTSVPTRRREVSFTTAKASGRSQQLPLELPQLHAQLFPVTRILRLPLPVTQSVDPSLRIGRRGSDPIPELIGLRLERLVRDPLKRLVVPVDLVEERLELLHLAGVPVSHDLLDQ
jgi:hypothetical protein